MVLAHPHPLISLLYCDPEMCLHFVTLMKLGVDNDIISVLTNNACPP